MSHFCCNPFVSIIFMCQLFFGRFFKPLCQYNVKQKCIYYSSMCTRHAGSQISQNHQQHLFWCFMISTRLAIRCRWVLLIYTVHLCARSHLNLHALCSTLQGRACIENFYFQVRLARKPITLK